jgi:hypothetical protein
MTGARVRHRFEYPNEASRGARVLSETIATYAADRPGVSGMRRAVPTGGGGWIRLMDPGKTPAAYPSDTGEGFGHAAWDKVVEAIPSGKNLWFRVGPTPQVAPSEIVNLRDPRPATREKFRELADAWRADTQWLSSIPQKVMHPAYQRIIGLGPEALPLIFDQLRTGTGYWFWALAAITGEDPAAGTKKMVAARDAWLKWAQEHDY